MMYTNHSEETRARAMALRGKVSQRAAARICKVHKSTIQNWWEGGRSKQEFTRHQKELVQKGLMHVPRSKPWLSPAERAARKLKTDRSWYYQRGPHRKFHPVWNPDPKLAPLDKLWYRSEDVEECVLKWGPSHEDLLRELDNKSTLARRWRGIRRREREWVRADAIDTFFTKIDLNLVFLPDPVYCTASGGPKGEQCS